MFDVGFSELLIISLVALLVFGPNRLPEVARTAGRWVGRMRRFMDDVKRDVDREINSEELAEFRKLQEELTQARSVIEGEGAKTLELLEAPAIEEPAIEEETRSTAPAPAPETKPKPRRSRSPRSAATPPGTTAARKPRTRRKPPSGNGGEPHG
jgi:sec-independent protein translocase protein TatB